MTSYQSQCILYTFPGNIHGYKAQIAASYSGVALTVADENKFKMNETNRSEEYKKKFSTEKVPAYENDAGVHLFEANAISYYLSNEQLRGKTLAEQSEVLQWIEYSDREIYPVSAILAYPCMGILRFNKNNSEHAKSALKNVLHVLNDHLLKRTYLVGERITLADITVACDFLLLFQWVIEPSERETFRNVTRWFLTLIHQKEFQNTIGHSFKLCEKTVQFDAKKFEELSQRNHIPQPQPCSKDFSHHTDEHKAETKNKKEKKPLKQQQEKSAKKPKEMKPKEDYAENDIGDTNEDIYANEPKQNDPFADMSKSTFNMDEFKRVYSNQDTVEKAIPYFWNNFDKENYSIWFCEYKYSEDLSEIFKTCNLVSGFFQRLDKLRKHAFASMCVFGEDNKNTIAGVWIWRGQELAFQLSPDWQVDYESYSWKQLSVDEEDTKQLVNQYLTWECEHNGKKFNQGKIFK